MNITEIIEEKNRNIQEEDMGAEIEIYMDENMTTKFIPMKPYFDVFEQNKTIEELYKENVITTEISFEQFYNVYNSEEKCIMCTFNEMDDNKLTLFGLILNNCDAIYLLRLLPFPKELDKYLN